MQTQPGTGGRSGRRPGHPRYRTVRATTDDFLIDNPQHRPWRPKVGITPRLEDAELVTLVVLQALLGFTSEARWLRYANGPLRGLFPYLPTQSGYNKRVRAATGMLRAVIAHLVCMHLSVHR